MFFQTPVSKVLATILTVAVTMIGFSSVAAANEAQGSAGITILESLAVSEAEPVDFGHIHRPSQGTNTFTLSYLDSSVETSGSGDAQFVEGTSSNGVYMVQGAPDQAIQLSVSVLDFNDQGISFDEVHINGPMNSASAYLDGSGEHAATVGGVVTIDAEASVGTHSTDVLVTVDYE